MTKVIVPPVDVVVDGVKCTILEVTEHEWVDGKKHYLVSLFCEYKGKKSKTFDLDVTSNEELLAKLRVEVSKFKIMTLAGLSDRITK